MRYQDMALEFSDPRRGGVVYKIADVGSVNIILGKNGCGKSSLLRALNDARRRSGLVKYITPERGGALKRDGNVETNMENEQWSQNARVKNRNDQFRQMSTAEFRTLETLVLRKIEQDAVKRADLSYTFDSVVADLNKLLENIKIVRASDGGFEIRTKEEGTQCDVEILSSGESELVSLGIEIMSFAFASENPQFAAVENWLLFDEPDVHLHPDLQGRLMQLLVSVLKDRHFRVLIATHSTSIVSALANLVEVRVAFMGRGQTDLTFEPATAALKAVMPIFGAHPLSNVFNELPILLVEGEDDERIWQQAVRSRRQGAIVSGHAQQAIYRVLGEFEQKALSVLQAVYDNAIAFSLRDRDDKPYEIEDLPPLRRARLNCRTAENLILSDDVLMSMGCSWVEFQARIVHWLRCNPNHPQYADTLAFKEGGWDRKMASLKSLRNILLSIAGCSRPWETVVGQAIAGLNPQEARPEHSLHDYLGPRALRMIAKR